ncbi:MAG: VCBS domain-containing protein, partial [Gammaproteobacteria bacterium]|nr:VCBS domain-containing protein [Gammaproteobacteria bacterium]
VSETVTITVTGSEDTPVITGTTSGAVQEDGILVATGSAVASDADLVDNPTFIPQANTAGAYGTFSINSAGAWSFTLDNTAAQSLSAGQTAMDVFVVSASTADGETVSQSITIAVTGTDDAPVVSGDFSGSVTEGDVGDVTTVSGNITISDVDSADSPSFANTTVAGSYGTLVLLSGAWTYTLDQSTVQQLDTGDQVTDQITLIASDGTSQTIDITINGLNDAPVALASAITMQEDTQRVLGIGDFGFTDAESHAASSITIQSVEQVGSLRLNGVNLVEGQTITRADIDAGLLTYDPLPNTSGTAYDSFTFTVNDAGIGTTAAVMTINVTPVNDGPLGPVSDIDGSVNRVSVAAGVGDAVGITALATDPDPEDVVSYTLLDNAGGRFTIDPVTGVVTVAAGLVSTGSYTITVQATSSDGSSPTTGNMTIDVVDAADDFATVHESALPGGSGRTETVFDDSDEIGQDISAGEPVSVATGNLLANDGTATAVTSVAGVSPVGGVITVNGTHGTLVVTAATGEYTYTLTSAADNSAAADDLAVTDVFSYSTNSGTNADLTVTIIDDTPQTGDFVTNVPEGQMQPYHLVFTLDVSGSMTSASAGGVVYLDDGTQTTRLALAKNALKALAEEYYEQSDSVAIHLVTFESSAQVLNGGNAYTDLTSVLAAIEAINGSGGTNYEDGLNKTIDALDANGDGVLDMNSADLQTISYFISDGVPTSGNTFNPVGASGWDTFASANNVASFAVGIGTGITDFSALDAIHNVDADASGTVDPAINVPDLTKLEEELLSTVPQAFGGSVVFTGGTQNVVYGADGGSIESIAVMLDTNADGTPDTKVTFTYDANTGTISNSGGFPVVAGNILSLDGTSHGFVEGKLLFDFSSGDYSYFQASTVVEGDTFDLTFVAIDSDGDQTAPTTVTITIVDGKPIANDDTDTLFALETELEGNVLTGAGTDGGVALSTSFTTFSSQGAGADYTIDNAKVTSILYRGDTIDLTTATGGTLTATASSDGSSYSYSVDANGVLTLTNTTDSSALVFNTEGYYKYTPAVVPSPPTGATVRQDFESGASSEIAEGVSKGILLSSPDGSINYDGSGSVRGVGIGGSTMNDGERLVIDFDTNLYAHGVQSLDLEADSLSGSSEVFTITAYHIDGHEMATTAVSGTQWHNNLFPELSGIGRIEVQMGSAGSALVRGVRFVPVLLDSAAVAIAPEEIGYTITDDDGDSDSATLSLKSISNSLVDNDGDDMENGTAGNDFISGLAGDDVLSGADGHDIMEGGAGNDTLDGGAGQDVLVGGDGVDVLFGGAGDDILSGSDGDDQLQGGLGDDLLKGERGDDVLQGQAGMDRLEGGDGSDTLSGGDDADQLYGGAGNDILSGDGGIDVISGGAGSDQLTGGDGSDTFHWGANDRGSIASPDADYVMDFNAGPGGDILDLSELLLGEESTALTDYLSFDYGDFDADGDSETRLSVDHDGGVFFQATTHVYLEGVDLTGGGTLTDQQIINDLLNDGNLNVDT